MNKKQRNIGRRGNRAEYKKMVKEFHALLTGKTAAGIGTARFALNEIERDKVIKEGRY